MTLTDYLADHPAEATLFTSLSASDRIDALKRTTEKSDLPDTGDGFNLYLSSCHSDNNADMSPSAVLLAARLYGLSCVQVIDPFTLDGIDETNEAARLLNITAAGGFEVQCFFPEFTNKTINVPGNPGLTNLMSCGMTMTPEDTSPFTYLLEGYRDRVYLMVELLNRFLKPVNVDINELQSAAPEQSVSLNRILLSFISSAAHTFPQEDRRKQFWADTLGLEGRQKAFASEPTFLLRHMTQRLVGMQQAAFVPNNQAPLATINEAIEGVREMGGIPTYKWHDGLSDSETEPEILVSHFVAKGIRAVYFTPHTVLQGHSKDEKVYKLEKVKDLLSVCRELKIPVLTGSELFLPEHPLADDWTDPYLKPLWDTCRDGALLLAGHILLEQHLNHGYLSEWAGSAFKNRKYRNRFFITVGSQLSPRKARQVLPPLKDASPQEIIDTIKR